MIGLHDTLPSFRTYNRIIGFKHSFQSRIIIQQKLQIVVYMLLLSLIKIDDHNSQVTHEEYYYFHQSSLPLLK
jgi:hypothetical protein